MDGGPTQEELRREQHYRDTVYRLACEYCHLLEQQDIDGMGPGVPDWAQEWYAHHKIQDAYRKKREQDEAKQVAARAKALSKLSKAERVALGL